MRCGWPSCKHHVRWKWLKKPQQWVWKERSIQIFKGLYWAGEWSCLGILQFVFIEGVTLIIILEKFYFLQFGYLYV